MTINGIYIYLRPVITHIISTLIIGRGACLLSSLFPGEYFFYVFGRNSPQWVRASSFTRFLDHTQRSTTVGRTTLEELSDRPRDLYLTTHNTHNRQISMPPVEFEPTISAGERPQTYALDRSTTGIGLVSVQTKSFSNFSVHLYQFLQLSS